MVTHLLIFYSRCALIGAQCRKILLDRLCRMRIKLLHAQICVRVKISLTWNTVSVSTKLKGTLT